jgi:hypothetical protein
MKSINYYLFRRLQPHSTPTQNIVKRRFRWPAIAIGVAAVGLAITAVLALTPANGGMVAGAPILINVSPGHQTDPHVSGDIAAYTDESSGVIRYYDFFTSAPGSIFTPMGSADQLSDVDGNHIAFARQTGLSRSCQVFDVTTSNTVQIGPDNSGAFATALGSDTVAFVSFDDIKVGRISNPGAPLANLSSSAALDSHPAVSPNGNAVVWQACTGGGCSILKSTFNGTSWSSAVVVANAPAANTSPDTDGVSIAYDSDRAGPVDGSDIYLQALPGGADTQLSLAGAQRNPSVANGIVAFESTAAGASSADLFIYEISTNRLFQLTATPGFDEQLNDVTVLGDGSIRVVWAGHLDTTSDNDILAQTFTLPAPNPGYNFAGFFQPVEDLPMRNDASAGSAIPVKFSLGGDHGLVIFAAGYPASSPITCDASDPSALIEETVNAGGSSLSYNASTDQYTYIWKTNKAWRGTCRMLVVGLNDGSQHFAKFKFR